MLPMALECMNVFASSPHILMSQGHVALPDVGCVHAPTVVKLQRSFTFLTAWVKSGKSCHPSASVRIAHHKSSRNEAVGVFPWLLCVLLGAALLETVPGTLGWIGSCGRNEYLPPSTHQGDPCQERLGNVFEHLARFSV